MKILLSFVGEQDPVSNTTNEEGSIVTLTREIGPDQVILFPTAAGQGRSDTQSGAEATSHWLSTELEVCPQVRILPLELPDPTDYALILPQIHAKLKTIAALFHDDRNEVHLNFSSGTPQMKSVWLLLANSGIFANCHLWQVMNPKFVAPGAARVKELSLIFLEEEDIVSRLDAFAGQFLFHHMADEMGRLRNISLHADRKERAGLLRQLFLAYQAWDLIQYKDAHQLLETTLQNYTSLQKHQPLRQMIVAQADYLRKLKNAGNKETPENLCDLYQNAQRLYIKGIYTDALARFWRVFEGLLYYRLREKYGIEPTDPSRSPNKVNLAALAGIYPDAVKYPSALGFNRAHVLLSEQYRDPDYCDFLQQPANFREGQQSRKNDNVVRTLRLGRNDSMAAHGMNPVTQIEALDASKILASLCEKFVPSVSILHHPLRREQMKTTVDYLARSFTM